MPLKFMYLLVIWSSGFHRSDFSSGNKIISLHHNVDSRYKFHREREKSYVNKEKNKWRQNKLYVTSGSTFKPYNNKTATS